MSISAISQPQTLATSANRPTFFEDIKNNLDTYENWFYLIPTISALAIGILFASNFALGLAVGAAMTFALVPISYALGALGIAKEDRDSKYSKLMLKFPLLGTLIAPIVEESFFRGIIQPLATRTIIWLFPLATAAFLGTGLSIATTVSVVATAVLFGLAHASNPHKNSHIQAVVTGIEGIAFGVLSAQFGLGASIAAHMAVNTFVVTLTKIFYKNSETASSRTHQQLIRV